MIKVLVLLLVFASSASAQSLKLPTVVFAGAATADWVTTYQANQRRAVEMNPTIAWLKDKPAAMVLTGAAIDVAGVYAWNHFIGRSHPKIATVGLYAAASARLFFAIKNIRIDSHVHSCPHIPLACN